MKPKAPDGTAATERSPVNWFLGIAAFLTIISASAAADAQTTPEGLSPAEQWVVTQVRAGETADLDAALNADHAKKFPEEKDRRLSAHFLEDLLTGTLPGVKLHRHGVRIIGAIIDQPVDLENAKIPCEVRLDHCQFNGRTNFNGASFVGNFSFDNSAFKAEATFNSMKVGCAVFFRKAVFEGPVNFVSADIASNFEADGAKFQNKEQKADFNSMKVGHAVFFRKAVFEGPVDFVSADVANGLVANEAQFRNKEQTAYFNSMKVGGYTFFRDAVFEGPVSFRYADFASLDLSSCLWPKDAARLKIQGMSYKYIRAVLNNEPESHKALLTLADQSAYTADVYSNLEEFFVRQGYRADADRAFIAGKRRERKENLHGAGWVGSWLLDWLVGYGRRPWQAGIPCAFFVALGCVLFSRKKMEPQRPEDAPRVYSRFWYSLGLFLPFVDLQADKVWKPKEDQTFLRNYMRVHILLGWILIPLVLAALTGLIK